MSETSREIDPATSRVLAGIEDPAVDARYPNRTHFIAADSPHHGVMATRALFAGDPVALVYPDGHELLIVPDHAHRVTAALLALGALVGRLVARRRRDPETVQLPPGARIEARDAAGLSIAA